MPRLIVFGQSHLAARLGELTAQLGLAAALAPLEAPGAAMAGAWAGRVLPAEPGTNLGPALLAELAEARAALFCDRRGEQNLALALQVRDACPELQLLLSFDDPRMGAKVQRELGRCLVLNPAELSAPAFVAAALGHGVVQTLVHAGRPFAFLKRAPDPAAAPVLPGVWFAALEALAAPAAAGSRSSTRTEPRLRLPWRRDGYLLGILGLIAATLGLATVYFHHSQNLPWITALYFVVTTFCTVGYGDFSLREASDLVKLAGIALMLASVTLTAGLFAILTNALVARRTAVQEGRRRYRLRDHVLVCGLGALGLRVAEDLQELGVKVLVIERDRDNPLLEELAARRIPYMVADATRSAALDAAGVAQARALVCALNDDLANLEIGLAARAARPGLHVVLRVFDGDFAERMERHFHIHTALSASTQAAPAFLARALNPEALALLPTAEAWMLVGAGRPGPGDREIQPGPAPLRAWPCARGGP